MAVTALHLGPYFTSRWEDISIKKYHFIVMPFTKLGST